MWLVLIAGLVVGVLFFFRPGGVEGPRPEPVPMDGKGFDHGAFTQVLETVVGPDGAVDYAALRSSPAGLDCYLGQLRAVSPANAPHRFKTGDDRLEYYINAHNAFIMAAVRDACPIDDVRTMHPANGLFWRMSFVMGEEDITLSTLESELIRGVSENDPAVHLVLIKGAKGFPSPGRVAFDGEGVRTLLAERASSSLDLPRIAERKGDVLYLSGLFQDYRADFVPGVDAWLRGVRPDLVEGNPRIEYRPFDWSLNGTCQ